MIAVQAVEQIPIVISHPDVACYQCAVTSEGVVVAVMLRPVYGRSERMRVLGEVAEAVRRYLSMGLDLPVYVVTDVDVYQDILHGATLDVEKISSRPGCYRLS